MRIYRNTRVAGRRSRNSIEITSVSIQLIHGEGQVRARVVFTFNGVLRLQGVRVIEKPDGTLFVGYPRRGKEGEPWVPVVVPNRKKLTAQLHQEILAYYHQAVKEQAAKAVGQQEG